MSRFAAATRRRPLLNVFCQILLLWTTEMDGLANFSDYLYRIIGSHSARASDGQQLRLRCPRHSTITVQSAFYGHSEEEDGGTLTCSAVTALQKVLSECQGFRDCQLPVNPRVFGRDPCPGPRKYLWVLYKCMPAERRREVACEGEQVTLRCRHPRVLNIYSAVYGRLLGEDVCVPETGQEDTPFECLFYGAVQPVTKVCHARQRCLIPVSDDFFKNPCYPGTRTYLTILYACVPLALMMEADHGIFSSGPTPAHTTAQGTVFYPKGSRHPSANGIFLSDSLRVLAYIKEHPERAALLFISSVCVGLLFLLLALSVRLSCHRKPQTGGQKCSTSDLCEEDSELTSSLLSSEDGKDIRDCWEDENDAAELAERIERREQVIQEIWMNAYLNGNLPVWAVTPGGRPGCPPSTITFS